MTPGPGIEPWEASALTKAPTLPACPLPINLSPTNQNREILISVLYELIYFFSSQQLLEAVIREDLPQCILLLAHCSPEDLNTAYEDRESCTALHISCSLGNIVITQLLIWVSL